MSMEAQSPHDNREGVDEEKQPAYKLHTRRDSNGAQMKHVFAGGSRKVTRLNAEVRERLDNMVEKQLAVFVGDANGADKAIQKYLSERRYPNVLVFCTAGECRNNLGNWPIRAVKAPHSSRDFAFFTAKDAAMASEAEVGFMLWDGQSSGTIVNVARMVSSAKPVVLYISPQRAFATLKSRQDLENLIQGIRDDVAQKVRRYIAEHAREFRQDSIFGAA